ncbi:LysR family transcriptional regulator [bacterium]|nr:LysR family transcriptional regulator [bacterium]
MKLKYLEIFIAVVEQKSFLQAAKYLHMAQSAVSYSIKSLEEDLHLSLFLRETQKTSLTEQGKVLYPKAKQILNEVQEFLDFSDYMSKGYEAKISIGIENFISIHSILPQIDLFSSKFPQTKLKLMHIMFDGPEQIAKGNLDILVSIFSENSPHLEQQKLFEVEWIPVCSKKSPLAKLSKLQNKDLENYPQIIVSRLESSDTMNFNIPDVSNTWDVSNFGDKKELLLKSFGWGFMPKYYIENELESGLLQRIYGNSSTLELFVLEIYMIRNSKAWNGPCSEFFWKQLVQNFNLK